MLCILVETLEYYLYVTSYENESHFVALRAGSQIMLCSGCHLQAALSLCISLFAHPFGAVSNARVKFIVAGKTGSLPLLDARKESHRLELDDGLNSKRHIQSSVAMNGSGVSVSRPIVSPSSNK